jgi:hypothetical protein
MRVLWSTTGASVLLCIVGCALLFAPWASARVIYVDPTPQADGSYKAKALPTTEEVPGYGLWQGVVSAGAFLGVLVFLVVTGPLRPVPWWRSALMMAAGAGIAGAVILGMRHPARGLEIDLEAGRLVLGAGWRGANYVALGLAVALVFVAAVELRWFVARRRDHQEPGERPEPAAAPDRPRD